MTICGPKNEELRKAGELHSETENVYFYFSRLKIPKNIESYNFACCFICVWHISYSDGTTRIEFV
jgi:hypothetical protein